MKAPGAPIIASVSFVAILMTILIQAPTTNGWGTSSGSGGQRQAMIARPVGTHAILLATC